MGTAGAVQTKRPTCRPAPSPPELRVPEVPLLQTTKEELIQEQKNDGTLKKCFHDVGKVIKKHRGRTKYEFFIRNELLYRSCTYSSGRKTDQLVLPKKFRRTVTGMAHDGIMSGHQGVSNTTALVSEEFFWPGVQSDIKRYVRSCDICQRTVPKGRVGKAPLGTMPTIVALFERWPLTSLVRSLPDQTRGTDTS